MYNLVIMESPTKASTANSYLGSTYKVVACKGHLRDLPKSTLGIDLENNFEAHYINIRGKGELIRELKKEVKKADRIFLATDPDREGEAISWHLMTALAIPPEKARRITFNEVTKTAVKSAIKSPRDIDMDMVNAQQARRILDRIVGYKLSPFLWKTVKSGLSAGRVQSVATRIIVERENEIRAFVPKEYWNIDADLQTGDGKTFQTHFWGLADTKTKLELNTADEAQKVVDDCTGKPFVVQEVRNGKKLKNPAPPFTTSTLQQEASRKLNFSTAKTMQVVQQLYEGIDLGKAGTVGLVTYIRTDSVRVSEEAIQSVRSFIGEHYGSEYCPEEPNQYKGRKNAQDAHEAIRPTYMNHTPESVKPFLTREQYNLYKLIYHRFLSSQMKPAVFQTLTMDIAGGDCVLRYYGEHMLFAGYRAVYVESMDDEQEEPESVLPVFEEKAAVDFTKVETEQHFTQPPARYTEASLVRTLEEKGIGRPSTYAPTITTIITRGYVSREKKRLYPTELGRMITAMMTEYFGSIVDTDFTASMEDKLDMVEEGSTQWKEILREFYPPFAQMLSVAEEQIEKVEVKDEVSDVPCDKCGSMMVYKMGRFGKFLACPNFPACRNAKPILHYIDAPCPKCGARLMEKTSKKNRKFYGCECYPECDFVSWEMPITDQCPKCGSYMVEKKGKRGETIHLCANETCRFKTTVESESSEE